MRKQFKFNLPADKRMTAQKMGKAVSYFIDNDDLVDLTVDFLMDLTSGFLAGDRYLTDHISYDNSEIKVVKDNGTILLQWSECDSYTQIVFETKVYSTEVFVEITHFNPDAYTFDTGHFEAWTKYKEVK